MDNLKLLIVEDNPIDQKLLAKFLDKAKFVAGSLDFVETLSKALEKLTQEDYDVLVLDLGLPDSYGIDTFYKIRKAAPDLACVIMSGLADEDLAIQAVRDGAHDYLQKGKVAPENLAKSIRFAFNRQKARQEIRIATSQNLDAIEAGKVSAKFSSPIKPKLSFASIKQGLANEYQEIVRAILANKMQKNLSINSQISNLASKCHKHSVTPDDIYNLRSQVSFINIEDKIHDCIALDLVAQMIDLVFFSKFKSAQAKVREVNLIR